MLSLHPRLVASGGAADGDEGDSRLCYCAVVACVSLLLFIVLAAAVSIARAGAITGVAVLLLGFVGWLAPSGTGTGAEAPATRQPAPAAPPVEFRLVHHRCACGLLDAAVAALPVFAYEPFRRRAEATGARSHAGAPCCARCAGRTCGPARWFGSCRRAGTCSTSTASTPGCARTGRARSAAASSPGSMSPQRRRPPTNPRPTRRRRCDRFHRSAS